MKISKSVVEWSAIRIEDQRPESGAMAALTKKAFHDFLFLLHSDPICAAHEYENIRRKLTSYFRWNRCRDAENLADEAIDRVIKRLQEVTVNNVRAYINGIARNVFLESRRRNAHSATFDTAIDVGSADDSSDDEEDQIDSRIDCLKQCLDHLTPMERRLILEYGAHERCTEKRKELADSLGVTLENLRVQVFRARKKLRTLVAQCLQRGGDS
jgi:RNA polymerase sigma factor (sigma-70 family)